MSGECIMLSRWAMQGFLEVLGTFLYECFIAVLYMCQTLMEWLVG